MLTRFGFRGWRLVNHGQSGGSHKPCEKYRDSILVLGQVTIPKERPSPGVPQTGPHSPMRGSWPEGSPRGREGVRGGSASPTSGASEPSRGAHRGGSPSGSGHRLEGSNDPRPDEEGAPLLTMDAGTSWPPGTHTVQLYTVSPVVQGNWALLGELSKFVPISGARFSDVQASSTRVSATLAGAVGELVEVTALRPAESSSTVAWTVATQKVKIGSAGTARFCLPAAAC